MRSNKMDKIFLEGLEFHAHHGLYDEERNLGNRFIIDLMVETDFNGAESHDSLKGTIDYQDLYEVVKEEMSTPSKLLEHVGGRILSKIFEKFPAVNSAEVSVSKLNPPIKGSCKQARVVLNRTRD